ncbi:MULTISPECIES: hypothetical protein [Sphingomonadaceae]|nr:MULTISPECIES: hypothetical protein [Sphingomonadaceae]NJB99958.1 transcription antitermination factor NusG [Sphingomonas trueperi]RSV42652.1 hypothetical protein CA233_17195 [Sphingomonas sp. ABOLD]
MAKFLALYIGSATDAEKVASPISPDKQSEGMAAWGAWMGKNADNIKDAGGPLGRTLRVSSSGVEAGRNSLTGYIIVEADTHEAAARLFESHPHFTIFPGEAVEVVECLEIPGAE